MSLAERAREAARKHPFLLAGLRAGVVNHRAAAEFLDLNGDTDAIATGLRRFAETLPEYETESRDVRVTMHGGVGVVDSSVATGGDDSVNEGNTDDRKVNKPMLLVGETAIVPDAGDGTAVVATGDVDAAGLQAVLGQLATEDVDVLAAGVERTGTGTALAVVVKRRAGPSTLQVVEDALAAVPT